MHEIGVRETVEVASFTFNSETILMTWVCMGIVMLLSVLGVSRLQMVPKGTQNILEMIFVWIRDTVGLNMGKRGDFLVPAIFTLFIFLLVSNWWGLIPTMVSPTSDLNTTLGLALLVVFMLHTLGLYHKGMHHISHFFQPVAPFVIINLIEEIAKPITLAFRLFGNILAGEILIIILLQLVPIWMPIPSVVWLAFSIFIGGVHAFIFTMLTIAYIGGAIKEEEAH